MESKDLEFEKLVLIEGIDPKIRNARAPLHILVIDDDPVSGRIIRNIFAGKYPVFICHNLQDGMNEYLHLMPDILFLDINLGDEKFNGFDILRIAREHDANANIVIISADASKENIQDSWSGGACGFMKKPFSSHELLAYAAEYELKKPHKEKGLWN